MEYLQLRALVFGARQREGYAGFSAVLEREVPDEVRFGRDRVGGAKGGSEQSADGD